MRDALTGNRLFTSALAALLVTLISGAYLALMLGWAALREDLSSPGYVLEEPLRQFFSASVTIAVVAGAVGLVPLRNALRTRPGLRHLTLMTGLFMVSTGLVGVLIVLPETSSLSNSGGFNPDFGHLLTWDNFTGALWLALMAGVFPYAAAFLALPSPKPFAAIAGLALTIAAPVWLIAMALADRWQHITAP